MGVITDPAEIRLRQLAKVYGIPITDVENVWKEYVKFDGDKSGQIEKGEFQRLVCVLLRAKEDFEIPAARLDRLWIEADSDGGGTLSFEEFLLWYMKSFVPHGMSAAECRRDGECPASTVYSKLGRDRFHCLGRGGGGEPLLPVAS